MIYEVRATLFFTEFDEAQDFYHDCQVALSKAIVVNTGSKEQEAGVIEFIENYHDEDPNAPCSMFAEATNAPSAL